MAGASLVRLAYNNSAKPNFVNPAVYEGECPANIDMEASIIMAIREVIHLVFTALCKFQINHWGNLERGPGLYKHKYRFLKRPRSFIGLWRDRRG